MEEDAGAKAAPVTRLRRRMSVEADETKSTSAPSTPTKKRSTRLAAKPQLELIDEHAITNSPKRPIKKSIARDTAETEEKPVTPARRSTRTKSNTSLVSEADDKPSTPARRNTRIKSNTSIVLEAAQSVDADTPRAKRANARRNSQVASDTETLATPTRSRRTRKGSTTSIDPEEPPSVSETAITPGRIRRTRKGSTSSLETPAEAALPDKQPLQIDVIVEEHEDNGKSSKSDNTDSSNVSPKRHSPRLLAKQARKSQSEDVDKETTEESANSQKAIKMSSTSPGSRSSQNNISISSASLIKELDNKLAKKSTKNKSMSDVEYAIEAKKRNRTKSWTTLNTSSPPIDSFYSDNESKKKKLKKQEKQFGRISSDTGSGDASNLDTAKQNEASEKKSKSRNSSINNITESDPSKSKELDISNESNKENLFGVAPIVKDASATDVLFQSAPSGNIKTMIFLEDSDSNTGSNGKQDKQTANGDQCVPVLAVSPTQATIDNVASENLEENNIFAIKNTDTNNVSVEPMDIDETLPRNVSLTEFSEEDKQLPSTSACMPVKEDVNEDISNKSRRKSSISSSLSQNVEVSLTKDEMMKKQSRKSSICATIDDGKNTEETNKKSERKSSVSLLKSEYEIETLCVTLDEHANFEQSIQKSSLSVYNNDNAGKDQVENHNDSDNIIRSGKKSRKSSLVTAENLKSQEKQSLQSSFSVALDEHTNFEECFLNTKKNSSLSVNVNDADEEKNPVENYSDSDNKTMSGNKSRKSSLVSIPESNVNLKEKHNKSKRISSLTNCDTVDYNEPKSENSNNLLEKQSEVCLTAVTQVEVNNSTETNKSKRKFSKSFDVEKSSNENKSTLVLSQIKDTSASENSVSKSPYKGNELSKSMQITETINSTPINKNLNLNYLTSTPNQAKNIDKLAIQMNTSIITPTNESKKITKLAKITPKQNVTEEPSSSENESSDEDTAESNEDTIESDESTQDESNLLDDEAEDVGDDYESGDSHDEEEREYERMNEITVKGETLTSDEDMSDDTDYEKDSFVVSSNEEDEELLSGSDDDLGMSDNELTFSAKSKKKYNERKLKEQKTASKEMFTARYGLDQNKSKQKGSRNRLDSTLLKSDEEESMPLKKKKRMRLESSTLDNTEPDLDIVKSKDNSAAEKEEIGYKKKKSKRLSESVCNESKTVDEKEITICNQSHLIPKEDPLTVHVKLEPKTPQKDLDISRVQVSDDLEQINVYENASMVKCNETTDPLQNSMMQDDGDLDEDSISENEEISKNYESVLKSLNKEINKKVKSHDMSLNINKKEKQKPKPAVVDELNLTQSKKDTSFHAKEKSVKRVFKKLADTDEGSSDSIDFKLLFSEDSNGSDNIDNFKSKQTNKQTPTNKPAEDSIPLKKTEAKTDIPSSMDIEADSSLNKSKNKKKKKDKGKNMDESAGDEKNYDKADGSLNFYVDTKGELPATEKANDVSNTECDSDGPPIEVLYVSENKSKNKQTIEDIAKKGGDMNKTPGSTKKKKNLSEMELDKEEHESSKLKTPLSEKKKQKSSTSNDDNILNHSTSTLPKSPKMFSEHESSKIKTTLSEKKKQKSSTSNDDNILNHSTTSTLPKSPKMFSEHESSKLKTPLSEKKKQKSSTSNDDNILNHSTTSTLPKSPKMFSEHESSKLKTPLSEKKKQKSSTSNDDNILNHSTTSTLPKSPKMFSEHESSKIKTPLSEKKKQKSSTSNDDNIIKSSTSNDDNIIKSSISNEDNVPKSSKKGKSKSKSQEVIVQEEEEIIQVSLETSVSKKRKRKMSANKSNEAISEDANLVNISQSADMVNKNKKLRISNSLDTDITEDTPSLNVKEQMKESKKSEAIKNETSISKSEQKTNKKRKQREDDEGEKVSKVLKEHSFDKVHVPRLPPSIIEQLEDKPKTEIVKKDTNVVSTSNFVVQQTRNRKNKPSDFLEESVYLNHANVTEHVKKKSDLKKPKVLPFLPTVSTSDSGFTTNFQVNVIPSKIEFVAQASNVPNFKNEYLNDKKVKKLRTYDLYKKQRSTKLSKY